MLFKSFGAKPNKKSRRSEGDHSNLLVQVEPLESRLMLAANVVVSGTDLSVTGSSASDNIALTVEGGTIHVVEGVLNQDTGLTSIGNLTINTLGGNDIVNVTLPNITIAKLSANTGGGDDSFTLVGVLSTGNVSIVTAGGNDAVSIAFVATLQDVNINTGSGVDTVSLGALVGQDVVINTGSGNSVVQLSGFFDTGEGVVASALTVGGNVNVTGGTADDVVLTSPAATTVIGGNLTVSVSSGNDVVFLGSGGQTVVLSNTKVTSGSGNDTVVVLNSNLVGDLTILDSSGTNGITIFGTPIGGDLSITGGTGSDAIAILAGTSVGGNASVNGGSGADGISIVGSFVDDGEGGVALVPVVFQGDVNVNAGGGDDTVVYDSYHESNGFPDGTVIVSAGFPRLTLKGGGGNDALLSASGGAPNSGTFFFLNAQGATLDSFEVT